MIRFTASRHSTRRGFTLVELMIVIVIVGILSSLAGFGFMQYIKKSKLAESDELVSKLAQGAKTYFTQEQQYGGDEVWHSGGPKLGYPVPLQDYVFPGGTGFTYQSHTAVPQGGAKLLPNPANLTTSPQKEAIKKLKFVLVEPTYFLYEFETGSTKGKDAIAYCRAKADFVPGGDVHLQERVVSYNGSDVVIAPQVTTNEFE